MGSKKETEIDREGGKREGGRAGEILRWKYRHERRGGKRERRWWRTQRIVPRNIKKMHFMPSTMRPAPPKQVNGIMKMWAQNKKSSTTENSSQKVSLMYVCMG